jgi:hypothetical protein
MAAQGSPRTRFFLDPSLLEELREDLEAIPGVWVRPTGVFVPDNAAWIVEELLQSRQAGFRRWEPPRPSVAHDARLALPWLHPMVVEPGFLTSYQREGVATALRWPNESGLPWSAGS